MSSDFESVAEQFSAINEDGMSRVSKLARLQLTLEERVRACNILEYIKSFWTC